MSPEEFCAGGDALEEVFDGVFEGDGGAEEVDGGVRQAEEFLDDSGGDAAERGGGGVGGGC